MKKMRLRAAPALVGVIASVVTLAAGPALGARINKCTTITRPGIYVLTRNISANGDCFVVGASGVVLDLGGRVVTGNSDENTTGIRGGSGVTVRNGTINEFGIGVALGAHAVVESVHGGNLDSGAIVGDHGVIRSSTIGGAQFDLRAGALSVVTFNNLTNPDGVPITVGPGSVVSDNTANSGFLAIEADAGSIVERNTVGVSAGAVGISAFLGSIVRDNTIEGEGGGNTGIAVQCPAIVAGNTFVNLETNVAQSGEGCTVTDDLAP